MSLFNLDTPILYQKSGIHWTIRHAIMNLFIFGSIGSGKTSGSGRYLGIRFLQNGFAGIVLTAKPGEAENWKRYAAIAGRSADVIEIKPGGKYYFNFLEYISTSEKSERAIATNIVSTLNTVIQASKEKDSGVSNDPFWNESLQLVLHNIVSLCLLAYGKVTIENIYNIAQSLPKKDDLNKKETGNTPFQDAWDIASKKVKNEVDLWSSRLEGAERNFHTRNKNAFEEGVLLNIESARQLKLLHEFFFVIFFRLAEKTRSIIDFTILSFMTSLLQEPLYSLFCKNRSNVTPEDTFSGKIIIVNIPVLTYERAGRDCQTLFKLIYQKSVEKRNTKLNNRPLMIFQDECQFFLTDYDQVFQSTSREFIVSTVSLTQNLSQLYSHINSTRGEAKIKSILGTSGTKIFHANSDPDTNRFSSDLVGQEKAIDTSISKEDYAIHGSWSAREVYKPFFRPEDFVTLLTGSPINDNVVEAIMHVQGRPIFSNNRNYAKVRFKQ